ncbi:MAG: hypothetical protein M3416_11860, partial [Acidobacteriota bacterium]|nr:hypothetical protein [Acidobacteriota bacterium]
ADAEADDFVLDLDFDDFAPAPEPAAAAASSSDPSDSPLEDFQTPAPAWADAPSAFAEAAHGEAAPPSGESSQVVGGSSAVFDEPESGPWGASSAETEAARTPFEFSGVPAEAGAHDDALVREVVSQDVPPSVASGAASSETGSGAAAEGPAASYLGGRQGEDSAAAAGGAAVSQFGGAKEFIEPQVVPADEPVPGTVEGAFTDGSVEGDVPKPPSFIPDAPAPPQPFVPAEPSTAGFAMGEARTGVEEGVRPAQLSPETIEAIARRVVELMSEKVVREIAWEVVPDLAELLIKRRLDEEREQ